MEKLREIIEKDYLRHYSELYTYGLIKKLIKDLSSFIYECICLNGKNNVFERQYFYQLDTLKLILDWSEKVTGVNINELLNINNALIGFEKKSGVFFKFNLNAMDVITYYFAHLIVDELYYEFWEKLYPKIEIGNIYSPSGEFITNILNFMDKNCILKIAFRYDQTIQDAINNKQFIYHELIDEYKDKGYIYFTRNIAL